MTNEQREAIELAKEFTKMDFSNPMGWTGYYDAELEELSQAIDTVLSMLKEKDKQINSRNGTINALKCALKERTEERDRKDNIIKRQDNIIDLMSEQLAGLTIWNSKKEEPLILADKEDVKQYFERRVEEC